MSEKAETCFVLPLRTCPQIKRLMTTTKDTKIYADDEVED
jgi:hypothetical protein